MKRLLLILLLTITGANLSARHLKGGFFTYKYLGPGTVDPQKLLYRITLTEYMDCSARGQQIDEQVPFTIFDAGTRGIVANPSVSITSQTFLEKKSDDICITGNQAICFYQVVIYELDYELPVSAGGYIISHQRCCRIEDMDNIVNSADVGNTYSIQIPGTSSPVPNANKNSSPVFFVNDTVVVCSGRYFNYLITATDSDNDSLSYELCAGYLGGSGGGQNSNPAPNPSTPPPFTLVPYQFPYSGSSPLGNRVTINPITGMLSGIAPPINGTGEYVLTVCVNEFRNRIQFAQTRKELHIKVRDCDPLQARLAPKAVTCDGFDVGFSNDLTNPSGTIYEWTFGEPRSGSADTSFDEKPRHTYLDTGVYTVKLRVYIAGGLCADSTTLQVRVYPGFFPAFTAQEPFCKGIPAHFTDITTTRYGLVTGWRWDFGDTPAGDTSINRNPVYTYNEPGNYRVKMIVGNTFGCVDTVEQDVTVITSLPLGLPHDTLICIIDTIQLTATGSGTFTWSPNYMINTLNSPSVLISPDIPTMYYVAFRDIQGCIGNDSVFVNVKSFVTISTRSDTTICRTDGIQLNVNSDALIYNWEPSLYLNDSKIKDPLATPLASVTTYKVTGNIGKCASSDFVTITTVPYPDADAGRDTVVCFEQPVQLSASGGSSYSWSPSTFLSNANIANPRVVKPTSDMSYVVTVMDTLGCPKPGLDTVLIGVQPKVNAKTVGDTSVVIGQPLQLLTSGGVNEDTYLWQPSTWLDNSSIMNPVALPQGDITYTIKITTKRGNCTGMDTVKVKIYFLEPDFYMPNAFSPNGDGLNETLKPVVLGLRQLNYFRIFNRSGKLIFSTSRIGEGWDGTYKGTPQDPGNYVWVAYGVTYKGEVIMRKGNAVLVR
ncbi:MAG: PKD domain-containing protein [Ferruginibacter sp.]